jgi:hypothetical protein
MKTLFSFLAFHLFSVCLLAQTMNVTVANVGNVVKAAAGGATAFFTEDFEDASVGYDGNNANAWDEESTSPNPKYTPALVGTQSYNAAADGKRSHADITSSTEIWLTYDLKAITLNATAGWTGVIDSDALRLRFEFTGVDNKIWAVQGSSHGIGTVNSLVEGTTYHFKQHWKNDGTASVEFTTTVWQDGGDNYASVTGGNANTACTTIYIGLGHSGNIVLDHIKLFTSDPGLTPP